MNDFENMSADELIEKIRSESTVKPESGRYPDDIKKVGVDYSAWDFAGDVVEEGVVEPAVAVAKGLGNALIEPIQAASDLMAASGIAAIDAISPYDDPEQTFLKFQKNRDKFFNNIGGNKETGEVVDDFIMNFTESAAKFGVAYTYGRSKKLSKGTAALGAAFFEGFTDDPHAKTIVVEQALRKTVEKTAPDSLADFDEAMNTAGSNARRAQIINRFLSGFEMAAFEKTLETGGRLAIKAIPEKTKQQVVENFGKMMDYVAKTKQAQVDKGLAKKTKAAEKKLNLNANIEDVQFNVKDAAWDAKSVEENITDMLEAEYPSQGIFVSQDNYADVVTSYNKKLESLVPEIRARVASFAEARGISEREVLGEYARQAGLKEVDYLDTEKFKTFLRSVASNKLLEQQGAQYVAASIRYSQGSITKEQRDKYMKSFFETLAQNDMVFSGAGTVLQVGKRTTKANIKARQEFASRREFYREIIDNADNPDYADVMNEVSETFDELMFVNQRFNGDVNDVMKVMNTIADEGLEKNKGNIRQRIEKLYMANILSSPATLTQNSLGSFSNMITNVSDRMLEAATVRGSIRSEGGETLLSASTYMKDVLQGHIGIMYAGAKAMTGKSAGFNSEFSKFADIESMTPLAKKRLMGKNKEEVSEQGQVAQSKVGYVLGGDMVFDFIQGQDKIHKQIAAASYLKSSAKNAVYVDDIFDVVKNSPNIKETQKTLESVLNSHRVVSYDGNPVEFFTKAEMETMGLDRKQAVSLFHKMKDYNARVSDEAAEHAIGIAYQTELTGGLDKLRQVLQDDMPYGRIFMAPFFTTPANIVSQLTYRIPVIQAGADGALGLPVHPRFYADLKAGGTRQKKAIAKLGTGIVLSQIGVSLYDQGIIQYTPGDIDERRGLDQLFNTDGASIVIGGTSIPMAQITPIGMLLAFGANMAANRDQMEIFSHSMDEELENQFVQATMHNLGSIAQILTEAPFMQGPDKIIELLDGIQAQKENIGEKLLRDFVLMPTGNMVPLSSAMRNTQKAMMEHRTRANQWYEHVLAQAFPAAVSTAYDYAGEPLAGQKKWWSLVMRANDFQDEMWKARMYEDGLFNPRSMKAKVNNLVMYTNKPPVSVLLDNESFERYNELIREQKINQQLKSFVESPAFTINARTPQGRVKNSQVLHSKVTKSQNKALKQLLEEKPEIRQNVGKEQDKSLVEKGLPRAPVSGITRTPPTFNPTGEN